MSDNSIDVDVKFHLEDINKLFEKIVQGMDDSDFFKNLDKIDVIEGSLLSDVGSIDDKVKFMEILSDLDFALPIMKEVQKMVDELEMGQDGQSELIMSTQNTVIQMFTISKLLIKMLEEKFPISEDMQKDLDSMNDALMDQSTTLDDKLDILRRSISNMFAPLKEEREAFKISPTQSFNFSDVMGSDVAFANLSVIEDQAKQTMDIMDLLIDKINANTGGRMRLSGMEDIFENLKEIAEDVHTISSRARKKVATYEGSESNLTEGQQVRSAIYMPQVKDEMAKIQKTVGDMMEVFIELNSTVDTNLNDIKDQLGDITSSLVNSELILSKSITVMDDVTKEFKNQIKELKKTLTQAVKKIGIKIDDEFFGKIFEEMFQMMIDKKLTTDPKIGTNIWKTDELVNLLRITLDSLTAGFKSNVKHEKGRELLEQAGIDVSATSHIMRVADIRKENVLSDLNMGFMGGGGSSSNQPLIDMVSLEEMYKQISDRGVKQQAQLVSIKENTDNIIELAKNTQSSASITVELTRDLSKNFVRMGGEMSRAGQEISKAKKDMVKTSDKVNEIIQTLNLVFGGEEIMPTE